MNEEQMRIYKTRTLKPGTEVGSFALLGADNLENRNGCEAPMLGLPLDEPLITDKPTGESGTAEGEGGDAESKRGE